MHAALGATRLLVVGRIGARDSLPTVPVAIRAWSFGTLKDS